MDKLLSLKETEKLLNVSKSTLQRWDKHLWNEKYSFISKNVQK